MKQSTSTILMVRPSTFRFNEQTAINNYYQHEILDIDNRSALACALSEFDEFVTILKNALVDVLVVQDTVLPETPDALFPNNWISFQQNDWIIEYSMFAPNRRQEKQLDIHSVLQKNGFNYKNKFSFSSFEIENKFLEGTGSMVLDRINRIAYASLSERTHPDLVEIFCRKMDYAAVVFHSFQTNNMERKPIYHTNVMMGVGEHFAVICADAIDDEEQRKMVLQKLAATGHEIIYITEQQMNEFAGNMLELKTTNNETLIVMSTRAFSSLNDEQKWRLDVYGRIVHCDLSTIETLGGGSARCMIAEIF